MRNDSIGVRSMRAQRLAVVLATGMLALAGAFIPAAARAALPHAKVCRWYLVRNGDQLGELALRFRSTVLEIRRANGLRTSMIYIGQRLCIPIEVKASPPPQHGGNAPPPSGLAGGPWQAEFWNNREQSGSPVLRRVDPAINHNWGYGSPDASRVFADNYSARWTRNAAFAGGIYRFGVRADDGFRLYVDGTLVLDQFGYEGEVAKAVDVAVPAGTRQIRLDYVERSGISLVNFNYYKVGDAPGGSNAPPAHSSDWSAEYFNNGDLSGSPVKVGRAREINFNWGLGSPASNVQKDLFSARYVQARQFVGGNYRVVAQVDDGVRVFVDDQLMMNEWRPQSYRTFVADFALTPGLHTIRVEYVEVSEQAALRVYLEKR